METLSPPKLTENKFPSTPRGAGWLRNCFSLNLKSETTRCRWNVQSKLWFSMPKVYMCYSPLQRQLPCDEKILLAWIRNLRPYIHTSTQLCSGDRKSNSTEKVLAEGQQGRDTRNWQIMFSFLIYSKVENTDPVWPPLRSHLRSIFLKSVEILDSKIPKNDRKICFPKISKIHFPGLGTLRIAIRTTSFIFFNICSAIFWSNCLMVFGHMSACLAFTGHIFAIFLVL